jgi:hypothetical protein
VRVKVWLTIIASPRYRVQSTPPWDKNAPYIAIYNFLACACNDHAHFLQAMPTLCWCQFTCMCALHEFNEQQQPVRRRLSRGSSLVRGVLRICYCACFILPSYQLITSGRQQWQAKGHGNPPFWNSRSCSTFNCINLMHCIIYQVVGWPMATLTCVCSHDHFKISPIGKHYHFSKSGNAKTLEALLEALAHQYSIRRAILAS